MATMYAAQQQVIVALTEVGEVDLAGRLERCMTARREGTAASIANLDLVIAVDTSTANLTGATDKLVWVKPTNRLPICPPVDP
jgi:hypothetical protein